MGHINVANLFFAYEKKNDGWWHMCVKELTSWWTQEMHFSVFSVVCESDSLFFKETKSSSLNLISKFILSNLFLSLLRKGKQTMNGIIVKVKPLGHISFFCTFCRSQSKGLLCFTVWINTNIMDICLVCCQHNFNPVNFVNWLLFNICNFGCVYMSPLHTMNINVVNNISYRIHGTNWQTC